MSTTNENTRNNEEHSLDLLQKFQLLLGAGENDDGLCDVVLIAGKNGQRIPAHRWILATSSPFFAAMFMSNMRESTETEVILGDVYGNSLLSLTQFCYTRKIEICADTVDELVLTASRLQFNAVVSDCSEFMKRRLDASNCLGVAELAELLGLSDLKQSADKYVCENFVQVSQQDEFLQLNFDRLKVLIASDDLNVEFEESVLLSVLKWLKGERLKHKPALLALVRLSFLPISILSLPLLKKAIKEANVPIRSRHSKPRKSMHATKSSIYCSRLRTRS